MARATTLVAVGNFGVGDYEEIVVGAINDLSGFVRSEAARVVARAKLTSVCQVLLERLDEESYPDVIVELVRALLELNTDRDLHHAQALLLHARPEVRAAAVEHWPWEESDTLKAILRNHLSDDDWQVRLSIVEKLASQTPDSMLREDFTQALSDPNPYVRQAAVTALGSYGVESIANVLYHTLRTDSDLWVRTRCVEQLVEMNDRAGLPLLIELLPVSPVPVQVSLARALGAFKDTSAIEALAPLLSHDSKDVRDAAGWALEQMKEVLQEMGEPR